MAKRNEKLLESPVGEYYSWKNVYDENENVIGGSLVKYNKETEENEVLELPVEVALINDNAVCFKGFNEAEKAGVWSNEVCLKNHEVVIRNAKGELLRFKLGDYQTQKEKIKATGAKYTKVLYVAIKDEKGEYKLVGIMLSGAALTGGVDKDDMHPEEKSHGYFNFTKSTQKSKLMSNYIKFASDVVKKKGKGIKFYAPVFEVGEAISEEDNKKLVTLCNELDAYLKEYYNKPAEISYTVMSEADLQEEDFS